MKSLSNYKCTLVMYVSIKKCSFRATESLQMNLRGTTTTRSPTGLIFYQMGCSVLASALLVEWLHYKPERMYVLLLFLSNDAISCWNFKYELRYQ